MFVTALLAVSLAAPVPKEKPAEVYFPTVVGTKRVLETTINGTTSETTEEVTKVEEKDGVFTVTMEWPAFGKTTAGVFEVTDKKVRRVGVQLPGVKEPDQWALLDLGVKVGDSWVHEPEINGRKLTTTFTLGKEEEVEVPAGKFKAIPVIEQKGKNVDKWTQWYAPGVGLVKRHYESKAVKTTVVLKSFTLGKGKEEKKDK